MYIKVVEIFLLFHLSLMLLYVYKLKVALNEILNMKALCFSKYPTLPEVPCCELGLSKWKSSFSHHFTHQHFSLEKHKSTADWTQVLIQGKVGS